MSQDLPHHARFGGLDWSADVPLELFDPAPCGASGSIVVARQDRLTDLAADRTVHKARIAADGVRFDWTNEASFRLHKSGDRIDWMPGPGWRGALPQAFFSSFAAITVAWRGLAPLHASAVVLHDRAWLIEGRAGSGKSTLTAELLGAGARFLSDDLSVLTPGPVPVAWRGRPALRLHPETARQIERSGDLLPVEDGRGKVLVQPRNRAEDRAWPVGGILSLEHREAGTRSAGEAASALGSMLFRPRIISALPERAQLRANLLQLAGAIPLVSIPPLQAFDAVSRAARMADALAAIERISRSRA